MYFIEFIIPLTTNRCNNVGSKTVTPITINRLASAIRMTQENQSGSLLPVSSMEHLFLSTSDHGCHRNRYRYHC